MDRKTCSAIYLYNETETMKVSLASIGTGQLLLISIFRVVVAFIHVLQLKNLQMY